MYSSGYTFATMKLDLRLASMPHNARVWRVCAPLANGSKIVKSAGASKVCRKQCLPVRSGGRLESQKIPQAEVSK